MPQTLLHQTYVIATRCIEKIWKKVQAMHWMLSQICWPSCYCLKYISFCNCFFIWYVGKSSISSNNNNNNKTPLNYCFLINWFVIERFGATLQFELHQSYIFQPEFQMFLSASDRCNLISILYQLWIDIAHIGMYD